MKFTRILSTAFAAIAFPAALLGAPVVSNVSSVQESDGAGATRVRVTYDLASPNGDAAVALLYSMDGGATFDPATSTTGDIGAGVSPGTGLVIDWAVAADLPGEQIVGGFVLRVLAEDGVAIPLEITSDVADGSDTQFAAQTLTFTFAEAVAGFDASDVSLTNATAGTFTPVSEAVYTLDITASGFGAVSVSVADDAAASVASGTTTVGASFGFSHVFMDFVSVAAGSFDMGRTAAGDDAAFGISVELPVHTVNLSAYDIGKFEVTNAQYADVLNWALAQGYLASNNSGAAYTASGTVFLHNAHGDPQQLIYLGDARCDVNFSAVSSGRRRERPLPAPNPSPTILSTI